MMTDTSASTEADGSGEASSAPGIWSNLESWGTGALNAMSEAGENLSSGIDKLSVDATGKSLGEHGRIIADQAAMVGEQAKVIGEKIGEESDTLSKDWTGKSLEEHGQVISDQAAMVGEQAKVIGEKIGEESDTLSKDWTGKSLEEHGQQIMSSASQIGSQIAEQSGTLAVDVHRSLDEFCSANTGLSLTEHGEALASNCKILTRKFTDLGSDGSSALVCGVVNSFVTAGEETQKQLTEFITVAAPHLQAHGPAIVAALESNCGVLKNITGDVVKAIPKVKAVYCSLIHIYICIYIILKNIFKYYLFVSISSLQST